MEEHERSNLWIQKHMDEFKAAGDELDQILDSIATLERRVKVVQAAAEKRMVALQHERCESLIATQKNGELNWQQMIAD